MYVLRRRTVCLTGCLVLVTLRGNSLFRSTVVSVSFSLDAWRTKHGAPDGCQSRVTVPFALRAVWYPLPYAVTVFRPEDAVHVRPFPVGVSLPPSGLQCVFARSRVGFPFPLLDARLSDARLTEDCSACFPVGARMPVSRMTTRAPQPVHPNPCMLTRKSSA